MITDLFLYIQFTAVWLGQRIIDGMYFGLSSATLPVVDQLTLQAIANATLDDMIGGDGTAIVNQYLSLGSETNFRLTGINVFSKGGSGLSTVQAKAALNRSGSRISLGGSQPMSPQTTFSVYFPCLSYGEKGTKWGLPGVYESDNNSGLLSGEGQGGT
ncbi:MAG: hypothetical protein ACRC78_18630, partial [Planktothrix sp.]